MSECRLCPYGSGTSMVPQPTVRQYLKKTGHHTKRLPIGKHYAQNGWGRSRKLGGAQCRRLAPIHYITILDPPTAQWVDPKNFFWPQTHYMGSPEAIWAGPGSYFHFATGRIV